MSCPAFALGVDVGAVSAWRGRDLVCGLGVGRPAHRSDRRHGAGAAALSGLGWSAFARVTRPRTGSRLLAGSMWLFVVGVGSPVGLQTGRVLLAHLSTPAELSHYALMAQIYAVCWSGIVHRRLRVLAGLRQEAGSHRRDCPNVVAAHRDVRRDRGDRHCCALVPLGPWAATVLSGGRIDVSVGLALAFGVLLVGQAVHLPANVLLTKPNEARWQALWSLAMAAVSIGLGCVAAARFGAVGVVYASALAIFAAQVLPDLLWVPRLVRRRPLVGA